MAGFFQWKTEAFIYFISGLDMGKPESESPSSIGWLIFHLEFTLPHQGLGVVRQVILYWF